MYSLVDGVGDGIMDTHNIVRMNNFREFRSLFLYILGLVSFLVCR